MQIVQWLQHYSTAIMMAVFVMIVVTTFWPGRRDRFDKDARIPLDDEG